MGRMAEQAGDDALRTQVPENEGASVDDALSGAAAEVSELAAEASRAIDVDDETAAPDPGDQAADAVSSVDPPVGTEATAPPPVEQVQHDSAFSVPENAATEESAVSGPASGNASGLMDEAQADHHTQNRDADTASVNVINEDASANDGGVSESMAVDEVASDSAIDATTDPIAVEMTEADEPVAADSAMTDAVDDADIDDAIDGVLDEGEPVDLAAIEDAINVVESIALGDEPVGADEPDASTADGTDTVEDAAATEPAVVPDEAASDAADDEVAAAVDAVSPIDVDVVEDAAATEPALVSDEAASDAVDDNTTDAVVEAGILVDGPDLDDGAAAEVIDVDVVDETIVDAPDDDASYASTEAAEPVETNVVADEAIDEPIDVDVVDATTTDAAEAGVMNADMDATASPVADVEHEDENAAESVAVDAADGAVVAEPADPAVADVSSDDVNAAQDAATNETEVDETASDDADIIAAVEAVEAAAATVIAEVDAAESVAAEAIDSADRDTPEVIEPTAEADAAVESEPVAEVEAVETPATDSVPVDEPAGPEVVAAVDAVESAAADVAAEAPSIVPSGAAEVEAAESNDVDAVVRVNVTPSTDADAVEPVPSATETEITDEPDLQPPVSVAGTDTDGVGLGDVEPVDVSEVIDDAAPVVEVPAEPGDIDDDAAAVDNEVAEGEDEELSEMVALLDSIEQAAGTDVEPADTDEADAAEVITAPAEASVVPGPAAPGDVTPAVSEPGPDDPGGVAEDVPVTPADVEGMLSGEPASGDAEEAVAADDLPSAPERGVALLELDRMLADDVRDLVQDDASFETVRDVLQDVFEEEAIVVSSEIDGSDDEMGDLLGAGFICDDATSDEADMRRRAAELEVAGTEETAVIDEDENVGAEAAATPADEVSDPAEAASDADVAGAEGESPEEFSADAAEAVASEEEPAAESEPVEVSEVVEEVVVVDEPTADAEAADEMEAVDADAAAGGEPTDSPLERLPAPLAKLLLPHDQRIRRILAFVNRPLSYVPLKARPIVDWVALSLLFWIPLVWIVALVLF